MQLAKLDGAEVTAVDNTDKLDFLRSLGADHIIDYTQVDVTRAEQRYDLIFAVSGYHSIFAYRATGSNKASPGCQGGGSHFSARRAAGIGML